MKINEPIGNAIYAPLLVRIPLGLYFVWAGLHGLKIPFGMAKVAVELKVLPEPLNTLYGVLLPFVYLAGGAIIFTGCWTTLGSLLLSIMLLPLVCTIGLFDHGFISRDLIILGATLSLLYSGAGAFSVDRFRKSG